VLLAQLAWGSRGPAHAGAFEGSVPTHPHFPDTEPACLRCPLPSVSLTAHPNHLAPPPPPPTVQVARAMVGLIQVAAYPINHHPARGAIRDLMQQTAGRAPAGLGFVAAETLLFFGTTLGLAIICDDLGVYWQAAQFVLRGLFELCVVPCSAASAAQSHNGMHPPRSLIWGARACQRKLAPGHAGQQTLHAPRVLLTASQPLPLIWLQATFSSWWAGPAAACSSWPCLGPCLCSMLGASMQPPDSSSRGSRGS